MENAQHAPSDEIAPRECGWKHGDSGYSAGKELLSAKKQELAMNPEFP
jgi:hypothetical protein